ncbi:unnamed protein product, partial [Prorocentrum cordatum]
EVRLGNEGIKARPQPWGEGLTAGAADPENDEDTTTKTTTTRDHDDDLGGTLPGHLLVSLGRRVILQMELSRGWPACPAVTCGLCDWMIQ